MNIKAHLSAFAAVVLAATTLSAQPNTRGYYKDIFMDSGIKLTSRVDLPSARYLGLSMEKFVSVETKDGNFTTYLDTLLQENFINGSAIDENGCLLYPDGQPRFRVIYMNGGRAASHGRTLGEKGRANIQKFIKNGGSYVGTCAGMFIASQGTHPFGDVDTIPESKFKRYEGYLGIWPGWATSTGLNKTPTGHFVEPGSPLLNYYDFGGDMYIDSVYHNGGGFSMDKDISNVPGTEILLRYDFPKFKSGKDAKMHRQPSAWAWKENDVTGRIVLCGSHPEGVVSGERLHLYCAFLKYALDGNGAPELKAALNLGEARKMDKCTHDDDPAFTKIGDKQYHHFTVDVPAGKDSLTISLANVKGWTNFDLYLFAKYDGFAFSDDCQYEDITLGVDKTLKIAAPKAGKLYISVFCDTTVEAAETSYGTQYSGRVDVLNGVPYVIRVD